MIKKFDKSFNGVTLDGSRLHRLVLSSNPNYGAFRHVSNYDWLHLEKPVPQKPEQMEWFRVTSGSVQAQAYTAQLHYQIGEQTQYAYNAGQFVIFDTLTYDRTQFNPAYCNYHIDQYLKLANPTHYVIVKETQSHLHFHTFLFYDHLDERYLKCPNHGRPGPRREISYAKHWWPYGFSTPVAWRLAEGDAWSYFMAWPTLKDGKTPLPTVNPLQSGGYLCKYLTKETQTQARAVKKSRGLGLQRISQTIKQTPTPLLRPLSQMINWTENERRGLPTNLLQTLAKNERLRRIAASRRSLALLDMSPTTSNLYSEIFENLLNDIPLEQVALMPFSRLTQNGRSIR